MSQELITYGADRRLVLSNGEAIRAPIYTNTWNVIRIGLHGCFTDLGSNPSGTPRIAFGVISGNADGYGAASSVHLVGLRSQAASWTRGAGPPVTYSTSGWKSFKKVLTVFTESTTMGIVYISGSTSYRSVIMVQITKGSPNFTFDHVSAGSLAAGQADVSDAQFLNAMEAATIGQAASALPTGYGTNQNTLAVDEADGALNNIFVYWDRTTFTYGFNIRHRMVS